MTTAKNPAGPQPSAPTVDSTGTPGLGSQARRVTVPAAGVPGHEKAAEVYRLLLYGIGTGGKLEIRYGFTRPATVGDIARIEKSLDRLLRDVLGTIGPKPRRRLFTLPLNKMRHKDDGDHTVTLTLDFAQLIPGERTPEVVEAARSLYGESAAKPRQPEIAK